MDERNTEIANVIREIGVVADDHRDRHVDLAPPLATDEVEHAVIGLRHKDGHALRLCRLDEPPGQTQLVSQSALELDAEVAVTERELGESEDGALMESLRIGRRRVLLHRGDVRTGLGEHRRHDRDDAGPVVTAHQKSRLVGVG